MKEKNKFISITLITLLLSGYIGNQVVESTTTIDNSNITIEETGSKTANKTSNEKSSDNEMKAGVFIELNGILFDLNEDFSSIDINNLSKDDLRYLRNAIYAKHGYSFINDKYSGFFSRYPWYKKDADFDQSKLLEMDIKNINLVIEHENIEKLTLKSSSDYTLLSNQNDDIEITSEPWIDCKGGNFPKILTIYAAGKETIFKSYWNDGIYTSIIDFDESDDFLDVFISETSTDIQCFTTIYRFDGKELYKYSEIHHIFKEFMFDGHGKIYYRSPNIEYGDEYVYDYCYDYGMNINYEIKNKRLRDKLEKLSND